MCIFTNGHVRLGRRTSCPSHRLVAQAVAVILLGGCGVVCLVLVFLVPVDSDVVLTASVVLRAKGLP